MRYIAYDTKLYRPGCVLIQASMGGDSYLASRFPSELWLTTVTPDMKLYPIDSEEFLTKLLTVSALKNKEILRE